MIIQVGQDNSSHPFGVGKQCGIGMCEVGQLGSLGVSGNIVVNYDGMIWEEYFVVKQLEVDHQKWDMETENSVAAQDLSTIV